MPLPRRGEGKEGPAAAFGGWPAAPAAAAPCADAGAPAAAPSLAAAAGAPAAAAGAAAAASGGGILRSLAGVSKAPGLLAAAAGGGAVAAGAAGAGMGAAAAVAGTAAADADDVDGVGAPAAGAEPASLVAALVPMMLLSDPRPSSPCASPSSTSRPLAAASHGCCLCTLRLRWPWGGRWVQGTMHYEMADDCDKTQHPTAAACAACTCAGIRG